MEGKNSVRIAVTGLLVLVWLLSEGPWTFFLGLGFALIAALMWLGPGARSSSKPGAEPKRRFEEGFEPEFVHENIALDTRQNRLWIRDRKGAERYLRPEEVASFKTNYDFGNSAYRQRIELEITDLANPVWHVMFQRHNDNFRWNSERNGQEMKEWAARVKVWAGMKTIR